MAIRVSIIIPAYNYGRYIADAIESIQKQTCSSWECLIVDDGSTDATARVVEKFSNADRRIKYIFQTNQGQPTARNTGLSLATGDYIQFLDADDLLETGKLKHQLDFLDQNTDTDIAYGNVRYFTNDEPGILLADRWSDSTDEWITDISGKGIPLIKAYVEKNLFELGCGLFRRSSLRTLGIFKASLQGVEDYDFCFRAALRGLKFKYLDAPNTRVLMRHHNESFSKGLVKMYKNELLLRKEVDGEVEKLKNPELTAINRRKYEWRLHKLQDLIIDQTRKGQRDFLKISELRWIYQHSPIRAKLYFFPRIVKAALV